MNFQQFQTSSFIFVQNQDKTYNVFKRHYVLGFTQLWRENVAIPGKLIKKLIQKPHNGGYVSAIERLVEK